ncbi:MAG: HAD family hydrolase [Hyphomonadaceae bacterium]|nr:HAD family hydrolase [Hyphomonadaceae bacterium]
MRRAVFFDRDGTLNVESGFEFRNLAWMPGAIEAVRKVNDAGWLAIVITNQSGIGRGLYGEADMHAFHARMQAELAAAGARIDGFYFCPFHPEAAVERYRAADHPDRKPNPGMILRALSEFGIDPAGSLLIGDQDRDIVAAERAGVRGVLYRGGDLSEIIARELA